VAVQNKEPFNPAGQREFSVQANGYVGALKTQKQPCTDCSASRRFEIEISKGQQALGTFTVPDEMAQVDEMQFAANNTLVIFGHLTWAVRGVVVYDLNSKSISDYLWCYNPALSPDKHLLIYEKFYPQHFVQGVSAEYLLYDLQKPASQNRMAGRQVTDRVDVGRALYPTGSKNLPGDNTGLEDTSVHTMSSDAFSWSSDSHKVAFADRNNGANNLVVVDVSSGAQPKIWAESLPTNEIVNPKGLAGICEGGQHDAWFRIAKIEFDNRDQSKLHVQFSAQSPRCLTLKQLDLVANIQ
jgi:hypothetical protein